MIGFVRKCLLLRAPFTFFSTILLAARSGGGGGGNSRWRNYLTGQIARDEEVILFPTMARFVGDNNNNNNNYSNLTNGTLSSLLQQQPQPQQQQPQRIVEACTAQGEQDCGGVWTIPIHGWIFEPERQSKKRRAFLKLLRTALNLNTNNDKDKDDDDDNSSILGQRQVLTRRVQPFLVDNERWKSPALRIGSYYDDNGSSGSGERGNGTTIRHTLARRSGKNGHFYGTMTLSMSELASITNHSHNNPNTNNNENAFLSIEAFTPPHHNSKDDDNDGRIFRGVIHLIPPTGLSIISDIDDTIKISNVTNKRRLLRNTFLEEFQEVPGMAQLYQTWKSMYNATFHFVSSSPYQLYHELEAFRARVNFPPATYHLKTIRPKDATGTLVQLLWTDPFTTKTQTITSILEQFPHRRFVLVGDSGEKDPEVYGHVARLYPQQIVQILIRRVMEKEVEEKKKKKKTDQHGAIAAAAEAAANDDDDDNHDAGQQQQQQQEAFQRRMATAFVNVSASRWRVFDDTSELLQLKLQLTP
jgi:hypothetical protein